MEPFGKPVRSRVSRKNGSIVGKAKGMANQLKIWLLRLLYSHYFFFIAQFTLFAISGPSCLAANFIYRSFIVELYGMVGEFTAPQQQWLRPKYASVVHNILFYFSQFSNCSRDRGAYFVFVPLLEMLCKYLQMFSLQRHRHELPS